MKLYRKFPFEKSICAIFVSPDPEISSAIRVVLKRTSMLRDRLKRENLPRGEWKDSYIYSLLESDDT